MLGCAVTKCDLVNKIFFNNSVKCIDFSFRYYYYKVIMGRPARNHGGTLGHGCLPFPGVRPNYNQHVLSDMTLQRLVHTTNKKSGKSTKLVILENLPISVHSDKTCDYVSSEEPKKTHDNRPSACANIKEPKRGQRDQQVDVVCSKESEGVHIDILCDPASTKVPRKVQADRSRDSVNLNDSERVHIDRSADSANPKEPKRVHNDNPRASIKQSRKVPSNTSRDSTNTKNPRRIYRNRSNESVKGVHIDSPCDSATIDESGKVQSYRQKNSFNIKAPRRGHDDSSDDSVNSKETGSVPIDSPSDPLSIMEPLKVQTDIGTESNLAQSDSQHDCVSDRPSDSVIFKELDIAGVGQETNMVNSDRLTDSVEKTQLPLTAVKMPGSSVPMPVHAPLQSNEIPGASRGHLDDPIVLPATSEQVNIRITCLDF